LLQAKPNIDRLFSGIHGGIDYQEMQNLGLSTDGILDFSTNCNPFGPPPGIQEVVGKASFDSYPDSDAMELKQALAKKLNISPDNLLIGSGSTELIRLIALTYLGADDSVLIPKPTYGEYEIACQLVGTKVIHQSALEQANFQINIKDTIDLIQQHQPRGIFLCNPNNPTGQYLSKQEIEQVIANARKSLVILDEAYIAFTENAWSSLDLLKYDNLVILRSMTKDYSLAGLRLGYAIAAAPIISILKRVRPPWNVNAIAQKAGISALEADNYIEKCSSKIQEAKKFLITELSQLGLEVVPSQTNFFLIKVTFAFEFRQALLQLGFLVRDCTSFGLVNYIRLAPRSIPECQKLIDAIKEFKLNSYAS
jgi:histidinol-phosphate aminotransferase